MRWQSPFALIATLALTACSELETTQQITDRDRFVTLTAGRALVSDTAFVRLTAAGDLTAEIPSLGRTVSGTWTWENGQFCRTLAPGSGVKPNTCQSVRITGDQVVFLDVEDRTVQTYVFR